MKVATKLFGLLQSRAGAQQTCYQLSAPINKDCTGYVIVSSLGAADEWNLLETCIFHSDCNGHVTNFTELYGSYKGGIDPEVALLNAGYAVGDRVPTVVQVEGAEEVDSEWNL